MKGNKVPTVFSNLCKSQSCPNNQPVVLSKKTTNPLK